MCRGPASGHMVLKPIPADFGQRQRTSWTGCQSTTGRWTGTAPVRPWGAHRHERHDTERHQETRSRPHKGVQFQWTCTLCPESHRTQVWLCFLVLSLLSTSTCAASVAETADLQICVRKLRHMIEKSDAMLYAPSVDDIKDNCKHTLLKCFMLELMMVLEEEAVPGNHRDCIVHFDDTLVPEKGPLLNPDARCPPCEAYSLKNITIFLDRLNNLLETMTVQHNMQNT